MLAAIVGMWLVWVAPFLLGRATPALAGITRRTPRTGTSRPGGSMMTMTAPQDDARHPDTSWDSPGTTPGAVVVPDGTRTGKQPFTPRWGRIAVALAGLLCLVGTVVTLVLGAIGVVSFLVPLACLGGTVVSVAALRLLAVRARRDRVNRAFAEAMAPGRESAPAEPSGPVAVEPAPAAAPKRPTVLFDAEETPVRPLTAMERRTAALAGAHGSSAVDVSAVDVSAVDASDGGPARGGRTTLQVAPGDLTESAVTPGSTVWAPVEVPRPTYVDAAKAERHAPAPLDLPEAPKAVSRTPIKASEAAARVAAGAADTPYGSTSDTTREASPTHDAAPATGRINLDDVLQRRRA